MSVNTPQTAWQATDGLYEFGTDGPNDIVDNVDNHLVDNTGNQIVDTGVSATLIPQTFWSENDGI